MKEFDTVIVGGGVSGIRSALDLAEMGYKVGLIEKTPFIGGKVSKLTKTFPKFEDAKKSLIDETDRLLNNKNIELMTNSEIKECTGDFGDYIIKITRKARFVKKMGDFFGKCVEVCPVEVPNEYNEGLDNRKAIYMPYPNAVPKLFAIDAEHCDRCGECVKVAEEGAIDLNMTDEDEEIKTKTIVLATGYDLFKPSGLYGFGDVKDVITSMQLVRMLDPDGPTKGRVLRPSDGTEAKKVGFILCVGSRNINYNLYCSNYCCSFTIKNALELKDEDPTKDVYVIYMDIRTPFKGTEELYRDAREKGVHFLRGKPAIVSKNDNKIKVKFFETFTDKSLELDLDLLVLAEASLPSKDAKSLADILGIATDDYGFFIGNSRLSPIETSKKGVLVCGCAEGLKDTSLSVSQGSAAASRISALISNN
ncbi:MAG TPA: CoB--CoM heterodisulfide reductase iron-sulfur subunit A family protein [Halobacteria archaeon]|nr:CoB--CoM heterodisulfide reductase iron-sulfur subunit A family protein [Halobacteria archaeon]